MAKINDLLALSQNPNVRKMLDLISYTEHTQNNGYYTAFGGGRLSSLADHPRYKKQFRQTDGRMNTTSAAGRYQFLRGTWDGLARKYGFSDFSPRNQDLGAVALLIQRGAMPHLLKGDFAKAIAKSGAEWASLPTSPHPQPTKSWKQVNAFLGGKIQIPQSGGYEQTQPQYVPESQIAKLFPHIINQKQTGFEPKIDYVPDDQAEKLFPDLVGQAIQPQVDYVPDDMAVALFPHLVGNQQSFEPQNEYVSNEDAARLFPNLVGG